MRVWTASYLGLAAEDAAPHDEDSGRPLPNTAAGPDTRGTERTELVSSLSLLFERRSFAGWD